MRLTISNMGNKNKTTIYSVSGSVSSNGFKFSVRPIECEEKERSYVTISKRYSKDRIMNLDTRIINSHKFIGFGTLCLEGQQQEALDKIKAACIEFAEKVKKEFDEMYSFIK